MSDAKVLKAINNIDDDILDELLASLSTAEDSEEKPRRKLVKMETAVCLFAAVLAILVLSAGAISPLLPTGWWVSRHPISDEDAHLLKNYLSKGAGLIAEDDFVRIEAAGSLRDGNTVIMGILVTMKQMDSAVIEGSIFPIPGYFFENWDIQGLSKDEGSFGCAYSDTIPTLQDNQFLFRYTLTEDRPIPDEITVELRNIGHINEHGSFTVDLEGTWEWTFRYDDVGTEGMHKEVLERVKVGGRRYTVEMAEVSMFGIELSLRPEDSSVFGPFQQALEERSAMLRELMDAFSDVRVVSKNGSETVFAASSGGTVTNEFGSDLDDTFRISIHFVQPIPTELIQSITMLDGQIRFAN